MKKVFKLVIFFFIIITIFILGYKAKKFELFPLTKWLTQNTKILPDKVKNEIPTKETIEKPKIYEGNDFTLTLLKQENPALTVKTAGVIKDKNGLIRVFEQSEASKILDEYGINRHALDEEETDERGGGLKRIFIYQNNLIGYFSMKSISKNCRHASLINLTTKNEFFKGPCLPLDPESTGLTYDGLGGGHTELNGNLIIAIGTPTAQGNEISSLAQNTKSPYGKILEFSRSDILNPKNKSLNNYQIISSGHRNPQGLLTANGEIYAIEHGPKGGDEINLIKRGKNYGWPLYSLGSKHIYSPAQKNEGQAYRAMGGPKEFEPPIYAFIPSVGASNLALCPESLIKRYSPLTCILASSLRGNSIFVVLIEPNNKKVISVERINVGMRVREFFVDSHAQEIYIASDNSPFYKIVFSDIPNFL